MNTDHDNPSQEEAVSRSFDRALCAKTEALERLLHALRAELKGLEYGGIYPFTFAMARRATLKAQIEVLEIVLADWKASVEIIEGVQAEILQKDAKPWLFAQENEQGATQSESGDTGERCEETQESARQAWEDQIDRISN